MVKHILRAATVIIVMSCFSIFGQETKTVSDDLKVQKYIFSGQGAQYFSDSLGSCLMELRSDGSYISLPYSTKDEGSWHQLKDGRIRLASDSRYSNIYTDELTLNICSKEGLEQLPSIHKRLTDLLDGDRKSFSINEIKDVSKCVCNDSEIETVSAFTKQQEFTRRDVSDLIKAIDTYFEDNEKNASYLHAFQYPQYGFFKDDFSSIKAAWNLLQNIENDGIKIPVGKGAIQSVFEKLNNLLKVRGLSSHFSNLKLSNEAMALLEQEAELDEPNLIRLNRLLLESAYPAICPETEPYRKVIFLFDDTKEFETLDKVIKAIDSGNAPQLTLRLVDKSEYDKSLSKKQGNNLNFTRSREKHQKALAKKPLLPPAEADIYLIPESEPQYFALHMIHTAYLVLEPDGQYRETSSGHFDVSESDRGTWKQLPDGQIRIVSIELKKHDIESGSLSVYVRNKEDIECLKALKEQITGFLNKNDNIIFSRSDISGITKNQAGSCGGLKIGLNVAAKTTSRNNLQRLLPRIDHYLQDQEKNILYYSPYTYRDTRFMIESERMQDPKYLEYVKEWIDKKMTLPLYVKIDAATFEDGSEKPQPFIYRPEGNEMVNKLREKYKKADE